jgi:dihydroflavonol-4-reductase
MILVTGATGLVGSHLLLQLIENSTETICAIYRNKKDIDKPKHIFELNNKLEFFSKIKWVKADILDIPSLEIAFENIDYVYHCAAKISFDPNDENALRKTNIEGTANIVNFCIDKKVKKLCYVSSIAALGDLKDGETIITEECEWNPEIAHSDYAISKYGAEMEVWRGFQEGLQVVIVNPGIILGNGFFNQGSGKIFSSVKKGLPFYTIGSTGYVCVTDVVKIMHQLMLSNCNGERFILIAENKTYKDLIYRIAEKIKAKKPTFEAKSWMLNLAWKIDWVLHLLFRTKRNISKNSAKSLVNIDQLSNAKIKTYLNYSFISVNDCIDSISKEFLKTNK